jgi:hypothetical protein
MLSDACSEFCTAMETVEGRSTAFEALPEGIDHYSGEDWEDTYEPEMIAWLKRQAEASPFKASAAAYLVRFYLDLAPSIAPESWAEFVREYTPSA